MGACQFKKISKKSSNNQYNNKQYNPIQIQDIQIDQERQQEGNQITINNGQFLNSGREVLLCCVCSTNLKQGQSIIIEQCNHYYDIKCFINHFKDQKSCCHKSQKIIINEKQFPKAQVDEIMKCQLVKLIKNINEQNKITIVRCSNIYCSFVFIYRKELNQQQSELFFCDICEQKMKYDPQMCDKIKKQTVHQQVNNNQQQLYNSNLTQSQNNCRQKEHQNIKENLITLPCEHKNCKECLFQYYQSSLKAICPCGKRYPTNIFDREKKKEEFQQIYQYQLVKLKQETNLSWQFCINNCGFFYYNINQNDDFSYCLKCDEIKYCFQCNQQLFSQYITIDKCNHNYHLSCSLDLLMNQELHNLICKCGQILDDQAKKELKIVCMICKQYGNDLIMLECCHFIHEQCFLKTLDEFLCFQCKICKVPIYALHSEPKLKQVRDQLYIKKQQTNKELNYFCLLCGKSDSNIFPLKCNHYYHQKCLQELKERQQNCLNCNGDLEAHQNVSKIQQFKK